MLLVIAALVIVRLFFAPAPSEHSPSQPPDEGLHRVVRVVDGDTIIIDRDTRVRLIGVNAPESVKPEHPVEPFGPEASAFTREFLAGGEARLTYDRERTDQYGRALAYVWVGNRLLNEELLRRGLARWEAHFNYAGPMKGRFRRAQDEAKRERLGIWSQPVPR